MSEFLAGVLIVVTLIAIGLKEEIQRQNTPTILLVRSLPMESYHAESNVLGSVKKEKIKCQGLKRSILI